MNRQLKQIVLVTTLLVSLPLLAWARPNVAINIKAEKEVVVTENGKQIKKIVEAKDIFPGEVITYTLSYENKGDEAAANVALTDPIPAGTAYIVGSASEIGDLTFSIDLGKSYKKPSLLSYEVTDKNGKVQKRVASPEEYTHIRWTLPSIAAGAKGSVNFKVKVK